MFLFPREFDSASFPLGREFDMAAILEDGETLEMSRRAKGLYCFFVLFWSFFAMSEQKVNKFVLFFL